VLVTAVTADRVPAYWLDAPGIDPSQVLVFVHGGGFQLGSLRSYGELAPRLGRASGMRVLFPEYRLAPSTRSRRPSTTSWPRGAGSAPTRTCARHR
jgi:epsilon-lactone hydrolase